MCLSYKHRTSHLKCPDFSHKYSKSAPFPAEMECLRATVFPQNCCFFIAVLEVATVYFIEDGCSLLKEDLHALMRRSVIMAYFENVSCHITRIQNNWSDLFNIVFLYGLSCVMGSRTIRHQKYQVRSRTGCIAL